jgi:hypothetical protein
MVRLKWKSTTKVWVTVGVGVIVPVGELVALWVAVRVGEVVRLGVGLGVSVMVEVAL